MSKSQVKQTVAYWAKTAEHDYETMKVLFRAKRYSDSLFFGHIVLEKILKGLYVKHNQKDAPYIHNLVTLAKQTALNLSQDDLEFLEEVNRFNIRARYPDVKLEFYKKSTPELTTIYLKRIKTVYKNLCQKLNKKN